MLNRTSIPRSPFVIAFAISMGLLAGGAVADDQPAYRITAARGPYFLCDTRVVEDRWLLERFVVPLARHPRNPLMTRKEPWEGSGPHLGGSVLYDPQAGTFLMWYSVFNTEAYDKRLPFSYNVCLAESKDGLAWERPSLGVFAIKGSTANNCIKLGTDKTQNIDVCLNPRPDRWPGKFLAIHNQKGGVFVSSSNDGATFTRLSDVAAIAYHSDTHNNFVYDDARDRWLLYCRPRAWAGYHRRRIALETSTDLTHWSHERTILLPTETEFPEYYGMTVFRRGDLFFGVVQIYDTKSGSMHGELAWSGDGEHWDFLPTHPPFATRGPDGSWDAGMVLVADSPVDVGDEMRFYYGGFRAHHDTPPDKNEAAIGLFTAERDRLVGLRPNSPEAGLVMTRPFRVQGRRLALNAVVQGRITAELRTDGNKPIPGFKFDDCLARDLIGVCSTAEMESRRAGSRSPRRSPDPVSTRSGDAVCVRFAGEVGITVI